MKPSLMTFHERKEKSVRKLNKMRNEFKKKSKNLPCEEGASLKHQSHELSAEKSAHKILLTSST